MPSIHLPAWSTLRRPLVHFVATLLAAVALFAAGAGVRSDRPAARLGDLLRPAAGASQVPLHAYAVMQLGDCTGNLSFLSLFRRPRVARGVRMAGILLGGAGTVADARRALGPSLASLAVIDVDDRLEGALVAVGQRATPFLVVLDRMGAVVFSSPAPGTAEAQIALGRLLQQLADHAAGTR
jgi:hypothetical protein